MKPTQDLEQLVRLSEYIQCVKTGLTNTDAFRVVTQTHFDYAAKSTAARIAELIIPFYSFQAKNFEFWLKMLTENPIAMANLANYFNAAWNFEDIDFDRIQYYESQLNHTLQANIKLNEQGLTLKVNPSFMDPLALLANPLDSMAGRITPILQSVTNAMSVQDRNYVLQNLPAQTAITAGAALAATPVPGLNLLGAGIATGSQIYNRYSSGIRSYQRTGSVLPLISPSIFGSVKTSTQYGRASYTNSRAYSDPAKRRPRRVNIYNKLYTDTGKNRWKLRMMPADAATIRYRIRDNQNRFR